MILEARPVEPLFYPKTGAIWWAFGSRGTCSVRQQCVQARQFSGQAFWIVDDDVMTFAEDMRQVVVAFSIDGYAKRDQPVLSRRYHGLARVLDTVASFILVEIVRLAVGQDQQQPPAVALLDKLPAGVAYTGAEPGVVAGRDRVDATAYPGIVAFLKMLDCVHAYRIALSGRETVQRKPVSGRVQAFGEQEQAVPDYVDDAVAIIDPGVGRQRQVSQQQAAQIAVAAAQLPVQVAGRYRAPGLPVGSKAQVGIQINVLALGLRAWF